MDRLGCFTKGFACSFANSEAFRILHQDHWPLLHDRKSWANVIWIVNPHLATLPFPCPVKLAL